MTEEATTGTAPARRRIVLTGISSRAWEHPADRGALVALRELRGFDDVLKSINALWNERAMRLEFLGNAIRVDHRQYPRVHRILAEAAASLDIGRPSRCTPINGLPSRASLMISSSWQAGRLMPVASMPSPIEAMDAVPCFPPSVRSTTSARAASAKASSCPESSSPAKG